MDIAAALTELICASSIPLTNPRLSIEKQKDGTDTDIFLIISEKDGTIASIQKFLEIADKVTHLLLVWIATQKLPSPEETPRTPEIKNYHAKNIGWIHWRLTA